MNDAMNGLRRASPVLGIALAWLIALGALLAGLSLARLLPEAHAATLAHVALCLSADDGAPAHHPPGEAAACCIGWPAASGATLDLPPAAPVAAPPVLRAARAAFRRLSPDACRKTRSRDKTARGPPRA